jgi:hypothetical protein
MVGSGARGGLPHAPLAHSAPRRSRHGSPHAPGWPQGVRWLPGGVAVAKGCQRESPGHPGSGRPKICQMHERGLSTIPRTSVDNEDVHAALPLTFGNAQAVRPTWINRSPGYGLPCGALVPHLIETPCNAFISTSIAQASHAFCDIVATNVGIMRKSGSQKQTSGWGPPGSGARGLIAMEQKTELDP